MDSTYAKQLMLAKYLSRQGEKALDLRNPIACGLAISHFQDAIEMLLYAAIKQRDLGDGKKQLTFHDLWRLVDEDLQPEKLPFKAHMLELNTARVGFKHYGNLPAPSDAEKFLPYTREFLTTATKLLCDIDFARLSLSDLIEDVQVRDILKQAENCLSLEQFDRCVDECARAEYMLSRPLHGMFPTVPSRITDCARLFDRNQHSQARTLFNGLHDYLNALRNISLAAVLHIPAHDFFRYAALRRGMPIVSETADHLITVRPGLGDFNKGDIDFVLRYVVDYALALQEHLKTAEHDSSR